MARPGPSSRVAKAASAIAPRAATATGRSSPEMASRAVAPSAANRAAGVLAANRVANRVGSVPAADVLEVAVRIVGGRLGGRPLAGPRTQGIRPTSDRLRESLFNVLMHRHRESLVGGRVLDLFAGTGALGLEAVSRGAEFAVLVDEGFEARGLIRQNIEALGLGGVARLLKRDATRLGDVAPFEPFTLAFLDPPYGKGLASRALASLAAGRWLAAGGVAVVEEAAEATIEIPAGLSVIDRRGQGETQLVFVEA